MTCIQKIEKNKLADGSRSQEYDGVHQLIGFTMPDEQRQCSQELLTASMCVERVARMIGLYCDEEERVVLWQMALTLKQVSQAFTPNESEIWPDLPSAWPEEAPTNWQGKA